MTQIDQGVKGRLGPLINTEASAGFSPVNDDSVTVRKRFNAFSAVAEAVEIETAEHARRHTCTGPTPLLEFRL